MNLQADQQIRLLCDSADFIDSGLQSFIEQVRDLPRKKMVSAAFYAGAALSLKLMVHFTAHSYTRQEVEFLMNLLHEEISEYMERHGIKIEWEPHVPTSWQQ